MCVCIADVYTRTFCFQEAIQNSVRKNIRTMSPNAVISITVTNLFDPRFSNEVRSAKQKINHYDEESIVCCQYIFNRIHRLSFCRSTHTNIVIHRMYLCIRWRDKLVHPPTHAHLYVLFIHEF